MRSKLLEVLREAGRERHAAHRAERMEARKETNRRWYEAHKAERRAHQLAYRSTHKEEKVAYDAVYSREHPESHRESAKRTRLLDPGKVAARDVVNNAVKAGRLAPARAQTCACGAQAVHYHHHNGYGPEHELDVIAACGVCHRELHCGRKAETHEMG